jgi:hypothetical protein
VSKEKKIKKMQVDPPEAWHRRPILTSIRGKCDFEKENPWSEKDKVYLWYMFQQ